MIKSFTDTLYTMWDFAVLMWPFLVTVIGIQIVGLVALHFYSKWKGYDDV